MEASAECPSIVVPKYADERVRFSAEKLVGVPINRGVPLGPLPPLLVTISPKLVLPDLWRIGPLLACSAAFKEVLSRYRHSIEFHDIVIRRRGSTRAEGQYFANVTAHCDCFDWTRSQFVQGRGGRANDITSLRLRWPVSCDFDIFRIFRTVPKLLAVTQPLAAELRRARLRGFKLVPPELYHDSLNFQ